LQKDLEAANAVYEQLLGTAAYKQEAVESESVTTSFFKAEKIRLNYYATDPHSAIAKFIEKREREFIMSLLP
jgi:methylmalonyl-CoA/ethylmalonyl-CoA epimerase